MSKFKEGDKVQLIDTDGIGYYDNIEEGVLGTFIGYHDVLPDIARVHFDGQPDGVECQLFARRICLIASLLENDL